MKRRFTEHFKFDPAKVRGLRRDHPALHSARTIFPSTVVNPIDAPRVLISGTNQRKIGDRVVKGRWKGMPIYTLTLEERATCPTTCAHWADCYGNNMHHSRRHQHGCDLEFILAGELDEKAKLHPDGFVIRLHILGDFYDMAYVALWWRWVDQYPMLRLFGYTAHSRDSLIGRAVDEMNVIHPDRVAIRFSVMTPDHSGQQATTIYRTPEHHVVAEGIVCPVQTGATDCCGTCALCWQTDKTIVFLAHGSLGRRNAA
jgi:hypothetical protein